MTATADNCMLTCYPFVAQHRTDYQIVTEQGHTALQSHNNGSQHHQQRASSGFGEAVMMPVESPSRPSTHGSTSSSSRFGATTSTYEESMDSITGKGWGKMKKIFVQLGIAFLKMQTFKCFPVNRSTVLARASGQRNRFTRS